MIESPIGISSNGRYFVDSSGRPLFWLGDTQWNLFRSHTLDEARIILENRKKKGFTFIQVMLLGVSFEYDNVRSAAIHGEAFPTHNPLEPNPAYFAHVDAIVRLAGQLGLVLVIGLDHPRVNLATLSNARAYGKWMGSRYKNAPQLIWVASYAIPDLPQHLPLMREIAAGLREGDGGGHLITCHPDPAHPVISSSVAHAEPWLAFNCIQTFTSADRIFDAVSVDFARRPPKPVVMAEGAYEAGSEYAFPITPLVIRQQAYWTYLAGGHHSYGHNTNWRVLPTWQADLDAPGAMQMAVLREIFTRRDWWNLLPDPSIFVSGAGEGMARNAAARAQTGGWLLAYLGSPAQVSIRLDLITTSGKARAAWIDPRSGMVETIGTYPAAGIREFTCPPGWEDALLLIEAAPDTGGD